MREGNNDRSDRPLTAVFVFFIVLACMLTVLMIVNTEHPSGKLISEPAVEARFVELRVLSSDVDGIHGVSWAPDSARIAVGEDGGSVVVWNAITGERILTLSGESDHLIEQVSWSPDGKWIAAITDDDEFTVWDGTTGGVEWVVVDPEVYALAGWSEDSVSVKTWNGEEYFSLWNVESKTMEKRWFTSIGEQSNVTSPDGKLAAWQVGDGVWAVHTLAAEEFDEWKLSGHSGSVQTVSWSPDSSWLAGATDEGVPVWNAETGRMERKLEKATGEFANVSWSPDGRFIMAHRSNGFGLIFDADRGGSVGEITVDTRRWWSPATTWSPDGTLLAVITEKETVSIYGVDRH